MKKFLTSLLRYLKPPRQLRFTKLSMYVIGFAFGIGLAAMNTGNNLLYMIFGMLLGFITASGVLSEISLRGLDVDWIIPQEFYAEKPAVLRLIIRNTKKKLPSFGIDLTLDIFHNGLLVHSLQARFISVAQKSHECFDISFIPKDRGKYQLQQVKIETRFPFGFFRKYFLRNPNKQFIVYPKIEAIRLFSREMRTDKENQTQHSKGSGDSFWGMKDFAEGDNPRFISWKNSAKLGKLLLIETEKETEKKIWVSMNPMEMWMKLNESELESAVSFAASFIFEKFKKGFAIGFLSQDFLIKPAFTKKNLSQILSYLALFSATRIGGSASGGNPLPQGERNRMRGMNEGMVEILRLWQETIL